MIAGGPRRSIERRRHGVTSVSYLGGVFAFLLLLAILPGAHAKGEKDCEARARDGRTIVRAWHNPNLAKVTDHEVCFEGYVSNFDGQGNSNGSAEPELLGIPHFVVHRVDRAKSAPESRARPRTWFTIDALAEQGIAPTDQSYVYSQSWRQRHPDWFERGHLAQKYLLERLGAEAALYSHNVANAVPQRGRFNKSVWLDLECRVGAWANRYGTVWVIAGPVFAAGHPGAWLKEPRRAAMPVAIPESLFKIVIRKEGSKLHVLSFVMPQQDERYALKPSQWNLAVWGVSVAQVERLTGQTFLLDEAGDSDLRRSRTTVLWPHDKAQFDRGCVKFAGDDR